MTTTIAETQPPVTRDAARVIDSAPDFADHPGWLRKMQKTAWQTFTALPMPARTDECWRFTTLNRINLTPFTRPQPLNDAFQSRLIARSRGCGASAGHMIFANDHLLSRVVHDRGAEANGIIFSPLSDAARAHEEIFRKHFMAQQPVLGGAKFAALHAAHVRSGTFLYVPANVELAQPLEVFHWLAGAHSSTFPHTLLVLDENSKVTLIDYFESAEQDAPGLACGVNDLYLGAGACLTYICVQKWSLATQAFQINNTTVGRDAAATALTINLGSAYARSESVSRLIGPGGRSEMLSVTVAAGHQEFDQRTLQDHCVPNTASDLLYKNSLDDAARTIFSGLIRVEPGAHKTDAYQKVRNLLLSDEAEANSAPGLEIEADDVRCTHGATSGQVDDEEVFYLRSRGIPEKTARRLIVRGFLDEVFQRLADDRLGEKLAEIVHAGLT